MRTCRICLAAGVSERFGNAVSRVIPKMSHDSAEGWVEKIGTTYHDITHYLPICYDKRNRNSNMVPVPWNAGARTASELDSSFAALVSHHFLLPQIPFLR